jgi:predicted dehydrogenase
MERGWHVVSACPACFTLDEAHTLKELKERTGLRYMMAESSYYRQAAIFARNAYRAGAFGDIYYTEAEYYHDRGDLQQLIENKNTRFYEPDGTRSWRWGMPPMHYPTHSLAFLVGVTGERVTHVSCLGWGTGDHPWLTDNVYGNPFWNETAMMRTSGGHMVRCNVFWLCAASGERAQWFGDTAALYMSNNGLHDAPVKRVRTLGHPKTVPVEIPDFWKTSEMLPEPMRHGSGHGGSAIFISAEFINALIEDREPAIDVYESLAMTVPGIVAHRSALKDGEQLQVPQFDP